MEMSRRVAKEEGILAGISSGAAIYAAIQKAKELGKGKTVVTVLPSNGERYLSTPLYSFKIFIASFNWLSLSPILLPNPKYA
ncbi:beta-cyano-L-alanine synthase [Staphylococcus aureus]|nr:beta-cyano-L-alanine synthase [Staphylococcus aureus]